MSSLMAYDHDALSGARLAALRSLDELRSLSPRLTDPLAHDLSVHVAWLRTALEQVWLPTITRVLALDLLTPFAPRPADLRGLGDWENTTVWVMSRQGWHVRHDPTRAPAGRSVTPADARALAVRLTLHDPNRWTALDWAEVRPLLDRIAADPLLALHFRTNLTRWAPLVNALGVAQLFAGADPDDVAAIARDLGTIRRGAFGTACPDPFTALPEVEALLPASRALLLPHLGLADDPLATAVVDLLRSHPSTASILLPALTTMPAVASLVMSRAVDDVPTLFRAVDDDIVDAALLAAVDPRTTTADRAETVIVGVGRWLAAEGLRPELLGALLAPWLIAFSPLSTRFRTSPVDLARLLATAVSDPRSAGRLATSAEEIGTHTLDGATLDEAAALVGLVRQFVLDAAVDRAGEASDAWNTLWAVASISAALAGLAPGSGVAVTGLSLVVSHWWAPDATGTARDGVGAMDRTLTAMAAAALADVVSRWRSAGTTVDDPPDIDDPATDSDIAPSVRFLRAFAHWRDGLPGGPDGRLATAATRVVYSLVSPASTGEHLAEAI